MNDGATLERRRGKEVARTSAKGTGMHGWD